MGTYYLYAEYGKVILSALCISCRNLGMLIGIRHIFQICFDYSFSFVETNVYL